MEHKALNQLLCAATVNAQFRETLLHDPAQAISIGYLDHQFCLTSEEREMVIGIQARELEEFADQVYRWISLGSNGNGKKGRGNRQEVLVSVDRSVDLRRAGVPMPA